MQINTRFTQKARKPSWVVLKQEKKNGLQSTKPSWQRLFGNPPKESMFYSFPGAGRLVAFCPAWDLNFRWEFSQHLPPYQYIKVCPVALYPSLCLRNDHLHSLLPSHLSNFSRIFQTDRKTDWCSQITLHSLHIVCDQIIREDLKSDSRLPSGKDSQDVFNRQNRWTLLKSKVRSLQTCFW